MTKLQIMMQEEWSIIGGIYDCNQGQVYIDYSLNLFASVNFILIYQ